jgi:hypothetical protein
MILLDGDGMIFQDHFLQNGEQGGKDAANLLCAALTQYVARQLPTISAPKIVTRIYANVKGLGMACYHAGIIESPSLLEDFVRGFNESRLLFDFVDVGSGKDRSDDKIGGTFRSPLAIIHGRFKFTKRLGISVFLYSVMLIVSIEISELFRLNLYNCHCHQLFLGCSHDNGYARLLEETLADVELLGRISLIEGVPFERELASLKASYRVTQFTDLFRNSKITTPIYPAASRSPNPPPPHNSVSSTRSSTNNSSVASAMPSNSDGVQNSSSWASLAASNPGDLTLQSEKAAVSQPSATIDRNKYGQRIDPVELKSVPRDELNRLKKMKLCNYHHLMGNCPNINKCTHDHTVKLTKSERTILQAIARTTPCHNGSGCDEPTCIYGHRCPWSEPNSKECPWGNACRFDRSQHGLDTKIVKVTKV